MSSKIDFTDAAKLWSMIYKSNFYDTVSETQHRWVEFAKEAKKYFKENDNEFSNI